MASIQHRFTNVLLALVLVALLALIAMVATGVRGGPLDPVTSPGPTMKTLDEVEPRIAVNTLPGDATALHIISEPGSYYLTDDIVGVTGKEGIRITSRNVTLDLNGFTLDSYFAAGTLAGIVATGSELEDIEVRNGTVSYWAGVGIDLSNADGARISDVTVSWGLADGILAGAEALVTGCVSRENSGDGIQVQHSIVTGCRIESNGGDGIEAGSSSLVSGNQVFANGTGIHVTAINNRIDGNHLTNNFTGLNVENGDNVIVRNSLGYSWTQNYTIAAGNAAGPFLSTDVAFTSENPWANFYNPTQ